MSVALADLPSRAAHLVAESSTRIGILIVHECPLFLARQDDREVVGEATYLEDVLLAREQRPDIVQPDGALASADPLNLVQQLRQVGVQGIMVFAPPSGDEETLFQFLLRGAMVYEDPFLSWEELLAKMHRIHDGECLITGDVLIAQGLTNAQAAQALGISPHIVKNHLTEIYRKLQVHDRTSEVVRGLLRQWPAVEGLHSLSL
jgi:DNA-binding NarL/FixJ family response regulator